MKPGTRTDSEGVPVAPAAPMTPAAPVEVEAKLAGSRSAFRALESLQGVDGADGKGSWHVRERRTTHLRDEYWDTPDQHLLKQGCTLRVRELDGAPVGELTFKGAYRDGGRTEETVEAPTRSDPAAWRRLPQARAILDNLREMGVLDALERSVVLVNPRHDLTLARGDDEEVLSLDEVSLEGHPYTRRYIEIELKRGSRESHDALVQTVREKFGLRPVRTGKLAAARRWLARRATSPGSNGA